MRGRLLFYGGLPTPRRRKTEGIISVAGKTPPSREQLSGIATPAASSSATRGEGGRDGTATDCVPPGGGAAGARAWRSLNRDYVSPSGRRRKVAWAVAFGDALGNLPQDRLPWLETRAPREKHER